MKRPIIAIILIFCFLIPVFSQEKSKLTGIKKIYLGDLGKEEGSDLVKEKIRLRLLKSNRFDVTETPEAADATLLGVAALEKGYFNSSSGGIGFGGTIYHGVGVFRLVNSKSQETIWTFEYKHGSKSKPERAADSIAENTVKQLLKDAEAAEKRASTSSK